MAGRYRSSKFYTYIYISIYLSPCGDAPRPCPLEAKPVCFPREGGHTGVGREQTRGSSSTRALGDGATTTVLCQWPGMVLLGVSHLKAMNPPVQVGHGEKPTPEVTCAACSRGGDPPRREVAALPVAHTIHGGRGLHQLGLAKGGEATSAAVLAHHHQTCSITHRRPKPGHRTEGTRPTWGGLPCCYPPRGHGGRCRLETSWGVPGLICWPARFINIC